MAFTALTPQLISPGTGAAPTYNAVDAANGNMFANNGKVILHVKNANAGSCTVTVSSVADPYGRTGDIVITIPTGGEEVIGFLDPALFNQRSVDLGNVHVTWSVGPSVTVAVIQLQ